MSILPMELFVIYKHPRDWPRHWVLRKWVVTAGGEQIATDYMRPTATLADARSFVPPGLVRLTRFERDDPTIAEVWL